ncbi:ArsR family transcriptional regulator [Pseudolysobacter antarcticus]|uniref:ArsR family transcriptional regulator n=1 Tax=Pseudolysobacter antarcticus TaxID=2511995 RepID=A0A411HJ84_9GAMM|nr:helix-turn-helix domain-containing protein [Pseudolysobacter antarcticus]QBB70599.1 ArsR family transcriptional regulator [Pseudolysobacter antarcticus]
MQRIHHPRKEQIHLAGVLDSLSDPTRLEIVLRLDTLGEATCAEFLDACSKTNLTYHLRRLREAGVTRVSPVGTQRFISLRRKDLDTRFPGLLEMIIGFARDAASADT